MKTTNLLLPILSKTKRVKYLTCCILVFAAAGLSAPLLAQTAIAPANGDGSSGNPYQIATWDNLYWISQNSGEWDAFYRQTADIDFEDASPAINTWDGGAGWTPIGNSSTFFTGTYDGDGHTISGLFISRLGTGGDDVGLFGGLTTGAAIQNTGVINVDITGRLRVGGLVGRGSNFDVSNSYSTGSVSGSSFVGGLVGRNVSATVSNSFWDTQTSGQGSSAGGTGKTTAQMKTLSTFSGWDFTTVWAIEEGSSYPFLLDQGTVQLVISGSEGWRMMSTPVIGASYGTLLDTLWTQGFTGTDGPSGSPNVLLWDETTRSWSPPSNASVVPAQGTAFIVYVFSDDDFDGTDDGFPKVITNTSGQFTSEISPSLSFTSSGTLADDGWNLVGNPYGATIDWDAATGWTKTNLDAAFYVWNNDAGQYQSWNGTSGTLPHNGLIAPWQGFWVKANASGPAITFTNDVRSAGGVFLKQAPVPEIRFTISDGRFTNSAILMLNEEASTGKDRLDAWKLQPLDTEYLSLFTRLPGPSGEDGSALDINALPAELDEPLEVPLDFDGSDLSGEFELAWELGALPDDWQLSLRDNETGQEVGLLERSAFSFQLSASAQKQSGDNQAIDKFSLPEHRVIAPKVMKTSGEEVPRFTLTILPGNTVSTEPGDGLPSEFALEQNYPNPFNPSTVISYQLPVNSEIDLRVFDMLGREVATLVDGMKQAGTHQVTFDAHNLASGMYIYRLQAGNTIITKKLTLIK